MEFKSGQFVLLVKAQLPYLFLGYCDYKRTRCVVADRHGNKVELFAKDLAIY